MVFIVTTIAQGRENERFNQHSDLLQNRSAHLFGTLSTYRDVFHPTTKSICIYKKK